MTSPRSIGMLLVFSVVSLVAACAREAAEPRTAETEVTSGRAAPPPAEVIAADDAKQRAVIAAARAELEKNEHGTSGEPSTNDTPAAPVEAASTSTDGERRDYETKVRDRVVRLDAKAGDVRQRSARLTTTKKTEFEVGFRRFTAERSELETRLGALSRATNESWRSAKAAVDKSLDDLESSLGKLDDRL